MDLSVRAPLFAVVSRHLATSVRPSGTDGPAEATEHFRQALRIKPDYAAAQSNLADAVRRLGRGKDDATHSRKAGKTE